MGSTKTSAGILMYRVIEGRLQVLLAHPGGPLFSRRDEGHWTIPKGQPEPGEELLAAAIREFHEETGLHAPGPYLDLGTIKQKGGKTVHGWASPGDLPEGQVIVSNCFEMEWPPHSGRMQKFPEVDRAAFFEMVEARRKMKDTQRPFLDRLEAWGDWRGK